MPNRTPLYDWHLAHGARLVDFAGWAMPVQYTSIVEEHQAVRTAAGVFDISHMGRLLFQGPNTSEWIQRVFTNDALAMKPGQVRYGLICNEQGGILDDVLVYHVKGPYWLMVVNASNREKIVSWVNRHRPSGGVHFEDVTFDRAMLAVQGPRAVTLLTEALASEPWQNAIPPDVRWDRLRYYHAEFLGPSNDDSGPLYVSRTGYTGEDGFEVILASAQVQQLVASLFDAARRLGIPLKACGLGARDTLRLEAGMPLYGHELTEEIDPFQAGLGWAVKMDKGDFIGRAALARRRQEASRPQRVGLELEGKRIAREGAAVLRDGRAVGRVTSGTFSPTLAKAIAMAYVEPADAPPGTACAVDIRGKPASARVVPLPFYRRTRRTVDSKQQEEP